MKNDKDIHETFVAKSEEDSFYGRVAKKILDNVKFTDKITEDMYILCVRTCDIKEPCEDSAVSQCICCNHDIYVSKSTYEILPENIQAKFVCNACILKEIKDKYGEIQNNHDTGKT